MATKVIGIDPGLVHTGLVSMLFLSDTEELFIEHAVVEGMNAGEIQNWVSPRSAGTIFMEDFRTRKNHAPTKEMLQGIALIKSAVPGIKAVNNTGFKKVITPTIMKALGLWTFATPSNHDDVRAAARIALFGMAKDTALNQVLYDILADHVSGDPWSIHHVT